MTEKLQQTAVSDNRQQSNAAPQQGWKPVSRKRLINTLNCIDFLSGSLTVNFKHPKYNKIISLVATPRPCVDTSLRCKWSQPSRCPARIQDYEFLNFFITDGLQQIFVEPELLGVDREGVQVLLPEQAYEISARETRRHPCVDIEAQVSQSGVLFTSKVKEFSTASLKIDISKVDISSLRKINPAAPVNIVLCNGDGCFFSGECRILRHGGGRRKNMVVVPSLDRIQRFRPKEYRSIRQELVPSPNAVFRHPCTGKTHSLRVIELSGCGFSVEEDLDNAVLLPGMILTIVELEMATIFRVNCTAQVIYSNDNKENGCKRSGLAILDMDVVDQIRLSSLLHQARNCNAYVCSMADLDALWEFFFETNFVYPKKYLAIEDQKERFRELYAKLYTEHPDIAINFTYQERGKIYGHMAMCRFYSRNWMIHHHAAISSSRKAGLIVLEQVGRYINEFHRFYSTHMDFVSCYYRPDNKFPNMVFGGVAKKSKDRKNCSVDSFAYFYYQKPSVCEVVDNTWTVQEVTRDDLFELESFYEDLSGGLMLAALDLEPYMLDFNDLDEEYRKLGLTRKRHLFSLKKDGELKAVVSLTVSDIGLNMSDLTNCFHVIVLEPEDMPRSVLNSALFKLSSYFPVGQVPVLIFPTNYAEMNGVPVEKTYNFWVLDIEQHSDHYFRHIERLMRRVG